MNRALSAPRRRAGVEAFPLHLWNLLILYRLDRDEAYSLNPSAQAVWQLCDGRWSVPQIAEELGRFLGVADADRLGAEVEAAVAELTSLGLLERG